MFRPGLLQCVAAAALFEVSTPLAAPSAREMTAPTLAGLLYVGRHWRWRRRCAASFGLRRRAPTASD
jgi:hypothetical protein